MNNIIAQKLTNIQNEPFVQIANQAGQGAQFANFDINSIQGFLSAQAQQAVIGQLQALPVGMRDAAILALGQFADTLRNVLASSTTQMFLIAASIMAVAAISAFFLKEVPLKHHEEVPTTEG
jgi:hypothetical protein